MNDRDWNIIYTLYQQPNITKAAKLLYMTQPTLTKRLQAIEKEWGMKLLLRGKYGVVFTPEGEYLAQEAEGMIKKLQQIHDTVSKVASGYRGTIKMGVSNSYGRYVLPGLMQSYASIRQDVSFDVRKMISSEIVEMVAAKELHMGIISGDIEFQGIRKLISIDRACAISKFPISFKQLVELPQVRQTLAPASARFFDDWWNEWFASPPLIGMQVNQSSTCYEMVSNGFGYALMLIPSHALDTLNIYKIPLSHKNGEPLTRNTWAICREEFFESPLIRDWMSYLEECR